MEIKTLFIILLSTILINNYVLSQILGLCSFVGISNRLDSALGMGFAVIFVMVGASLFTYFIYKYILLPYDLVYLRTIAFILVIAAFVQLVEMFIEKYAPALYQALGIYLPLITTNCTVFGVAILNIDSGFAVADMGLVKSLVQGAGGGIGYTLALLLMAGIRERLDLADIPEYMKGSPITFITAGLMAMAFLGFSGMKI
jgi:Na+-translocating ferredoxin:NAD+ oxidoreductase subunit A